MFSPFPLKITRFKPFNMFSKRADPFSFFLLITNADCELQNDDCGLVIGALWISPLNSCVAYGSCGYGNLGSELF